MSGPRGQNRYRLPVSKFFLFFFFFLFNVCLLEEEEEHPSPLKGTENNRRFTKIFEESTEDTICCVEEKLRMIEGAMKSGSRREFCTQLIQETVDGFRRSMEAVKIMYRQIEVDHKNLDSTLELLEGSINALYTKLGEV